MKPFVCILWLFLSLGFAQSPRPATQLPSASAIIDRAVKAIDGEGKMAGAPAVYWSEDGPTGNGYRNVIEIEFKDLHNFKKSDVIISIGAAGGVLFEESIWVSGDKMTVRSEGGSGTESTEMLRWGMYR